jgi:hypothetical protein
MESKSINISDELNSLLSKLVVEIDRDRKQIEQLMRRIDKNEELLKVITSSEELLKITKGSISANIESESARGPKTKTLKIEGEWTEAVKKSFLKKRPPQGWPKSGWSSKS